ncbi:MAG: RidA family protein [Paracoccaceae bacterium]|nr:RidA family protein [Paracoccaceae bacterium]
MRRLKFYNPDQIAPPGSNYSHGAYIEIPGERVIIAGQVGVAPDGRLEDGFEAQSRCAWQNLFAVLEAAGLGKRSLVRVVIYVTRNDVVEQYRTIRDEMMEGHKPPMTYLVVSGLASPDMLVEIEGEAVRAGREERQPGSER